MEGNLISHFLDSLLLLCAFIFNYMLIVFNHNDRIRTWCLYRFHAKVQFTYGPEHGCGGNIIVTEGSPQTIQSHDENNDGKYENDMDCHWLITGDAGKVLKLTFTTFNLEAPEYESGKQICYDFVEVYLF